MSQLFASGGQSIGVSASASVLPMNTQDWSPLGWTGWISLQSKGLSRVFSNTTVQKINCSLSESQAAVPLLCRVQFFTTLWSVAHQAPLSMGVSRQEYWRGMPCPSPGDLPNPGTEPRSLTLQADSFPSEPPGKPSKSQFPRTISHHPHLKLKDIEFS